MTTANLAALICPVGFNVRRAASGSGGVPPVRTLRAGQAAATPREKVLPGHGSGSLG